MHFAQKLQMLTDGDGTVEVEMETEEEVAGKQVVVGLIAGGNRISSIAVTITITQSSTVTTVVLIVTIVHLGIISTTKNTSVPSLTLKCQP